jgi:hypothetical protein
MISLELQQFYTRWLQKAELYQSQTLQDCFDKFFTLYVAYNRLCTELALSCAKRGIWRWNYISDGLVAKSNVQSYLGNTYIIDALQDDDTCKISILTVIDLLERKAFTIKWDVLQKVRKYIKHQYTEQKFISTVNNYKEEDSYLLEGLKSEKSDRKVHAILDLIYSIRCNMFHGQKGYIGDQIQILLPVNALLTKIMNLLYDKMNQDDNIGGSWAL